MKKDRIINCITNLIGAGIELEDDVDLKVYGLDSILKVQLVIGLEEEFNITFDDDDVLQSNFSTINSINDLLIKYGIV